MKNFIFYTMDGFTQDNALKEVSNMQILGFAHGSNLEKAHKKFLKYYKKYDCEFKSIIAQEVLGHPVYL